MVVASASLATIDEAGHFAVFPQQDVFLRGLSARDLFPLIREGQAKPRTSSVASLSRSAWGMGARPNRHVHSFASREGL